VRTRPLRYAALATLGLVAALFLGAGCGNGSGEGRITVFAAASLTDAFTDVGSDFEAATGTDVTFSFAGSQDLATQVQQGAPADVLATADTATMDAVTDELAGRPQVFAHNTLVIVVPAGNPQHVTGLADLARVDVVLADPSVPAGRYAAQALADAGVSVRPLSLELDVRSVLTKVTLGEADAGVVYATDARSAGRDVDTVAIPDSPTATYAVAAVTGAGTEFADYVASARSATVLARYGFLPP
jgi:molybdate transport system substrate-binding protein